jgi:hypothetical protein
METRKKILFKKLQKSDNEYLKGYFFNMGLSRSGHNFIKENVESWTNSIERKYINLENYTPKSFINDKDLISDVFLYNSSIKIISLRSLLNWYISYFYLFSNAPNNPKNIDLKNVFHISQKTPELEKQSGIVFIPDSVDKQSYIDEKNFFNIEGKIDRLKVELDIWLENAKEIKGHTNYLPEFTKIYYDQFVVNRDYRIDICQKIGGTYNEGKLEYIPRNGMYSSFDSDKYQGIGSNMKVLERYKQWKEKDKQYLYILKNHESLEFYLSNFDVSEDQKKFIENI